MSLGGLVCACECGCTGRSEEGVGFLGAAGVSGSYEQLRVDPGKQNFGPLKEQQVLLLSEPSL